MSLAHLSVQKSYSTQIKKLGKRVSKLRQLRGFSQADLAGKCEVDIRTIQRVEKGEHGTGLHILFAIADALSISLTELFE